jgi:arginine decarboxylase
LALSNGQDTPIICNGFKDDEFIQTVVLARKIGKQIIPVVEKFSELEAIVRYAEQLSVRPSWPRGALAAGVLALASGVSLA